MELLCINCGFDIDARTANVHTNLVQCPNCHTIHKVNVLLDAQDKIEELPTKGFLDEKPSNTIFDNRKYELTNFEDGVEDGVEDKFENAFQAVPINSRIETYNTSTNLEIYIPTKGFEATDIFLIFFTTFWLCFVALWTFFAAMASILFAMFSIPFWFVGLGLATSLVSKFTEKQSIELDKYSLIITKTALFSKNIYEFDMEDIRAIQKEKASLKSSFRNVRFAGFGSGKTGSLLPTIKTRNMDLTVFEFVSEQEQNWGMRVLKQGIAKFAERKV